VGRARKLADALSLFVHDQKVSHPLAADRPPAASSSKEEIPMHHSERSQSFFALLLLTAFAFVLMCDEARVAAQDKKGAATAAAAAAQDEPAFREYKGVSLGMSTDDARKKLGSAAEKSNEQDVYVFSDTETVQVYYDKSQKVNAISINFIGDGNGVPKAKAVLGTEAEPKPDGSVHKLMRFPKAGYWVSYSRSAGDSPVITITMKKIDQ
jgi:hypothetical protein